MADNQNLSEESIKQIEKFNEELSKISDRIVDLGGTLGDNLVKNLQNSVNAARRMSDPLKDANNIGKQLNKLIDENETLIIRKKVAEDNYVKALQKGNDAQIKSTQETLKEISAQLKIQQGIEDQLRLLQRVAEKEKEITEEKKKQNNLGELLKKKYEGIVKGFKDAFTLGSLIDMLFKGSENIANFRKELGMSYENAYALNTQLSFVGNNVFDAYINGEKLKKAFTDLSKEMGFVVDYGNESLVTMTNLTGRLGMSNKEAAQLTTLSRMQSKDTEAVLDNVGKTVTAMNKQGKTSILLKDVMKDIANVSKAIAVSLGSNPIKIAEAVVAAKQLGTTLEQLESTAEALLNFETSIEDELRAELLTGKQMNLERARAAALANDMKTLSEEIGKNEEVISAFASGNRLAQEATAKALGMNREQLAAMIYQQEALKIGAEGVRAKYGEQAYEQLKAQNAQEKFNNTIDKLKSALSSVVQIFSPIIDLLATVSEFVANIVSQWYILYPLIGLVALSYLPKMASSFAGIGKSITGIGTNFKNLFSKEGRASLVGGADKAKETAEKAAGAGDKAGAGGPKAGEGIKNTLKGISSGISSFSKVKATDILKVAGSALALVALTPAIPALLALQFVNGKAIQSALTGVGNGFKAIGNALSNPKVILGVGVFTLALMGIGKAIQFIAPTVEALGNAIANIVTAIAGGISSIVTSLGETIVKLGESLPSLLLLGPALFGISAGLTAMSISGFLALPSILALTALGAVAPALASIGIGGGGEENTTEGTTINNGIDLTPMINAIKEVKTAVDNLVNRPITVNLDGKKVGNGLVQGSYKVA